MREYTKSIRKKLNDLAALAYERELEQALDELLRNFQEWKENKIDCFKLNQLIHEYHEKKSREIRNTHSGSDSDFLVYRAVKPGFLPKSEVADEGYLWRVGPSQQIEITGKE
jgi:hypothetical protein